MITSKTLKPLLVLILAGGLIIASTGSAKAAGFNIARVGSSQPISLKSYVFWAKVTSRTQGSSSSIASGLVAVPRAYGSCVRTAHSRGQSWKTAWKTCDNIFRDTNPAVMQLLITSAWIRGEAKQRGLSVSSKELNDQFNETRRAAFPNKLAFIKFLRQSGQTESSLRGRIKDDILANKIRDDVTKGMNEQESQEALAEFQSTFYSKWRAKTTCNRAFAYGVHGRSAAGFQQLCGKLVS